ncbi:MAG: mycothiol synthase [Nocardioidaceae bacterium]|nr:MAG: mycothiol synthase [Nocardioidaceae bacterium]
MSSSSRSNQPLASVGWEPRCYRSAAHDTWSFGNHPGARALADDYGWQAERTLLQMTRRAGQPGLTQPTLEPGVVIRTYQEGDEAAFLQVNAAAFAQHPEQGALTADGLHERLSSPGLGPEGFFVAEIDGSLAGFHWTKLHPDGRGEVYVIGVTPAAQGRGLGNTLMARGLEHLAQSTRGADVLLYVEADNEPAVALYSKLGFEITQRDVQYTRR